MMLYIGQVYVHPGHVCEAGFPPKLYATNLRKLRTQRSDVIILHITIDTQSINSNSSCHFFFRYLLLIE